MTNLKNALGLTERTNTAIDYSTCWQTFIFMKQTWLDVYLGKFKWYRKLRKGTWYKHQFTKDAEELTFPQGNTWWARYGKINRYSDVVATEVF